MLCDAESGYICKFKLYGGNGEKLQNLVYDLLVGCENKCHHIYMDNYYNSVDLAEHSLSKKIRICGTKCKGKCRITFRLEKN
uniref:Piggybac transposable element-derived protein 4-like protein n=1 Tax=Triatoma infestans TaxID=30076 RepID=A0A170VRY2_TRIIF